MPSQMKRSVSYLILSPRNITVSVTDVEQGLHLALRRVVLVAVLLSSTSTSIQVNADSTSS